MEILKMDLYDSLEKQQKEAFAEKIDIFTKKATLYVEQGFEEESVAELIQIDGCPPDLSKKIANATMEKYPVMYTVENPPKSFFDIKEKVESTIKTASIDKIATYFKKYSEKDFGDIVQRIEEARQMNSKQIYDDVINEIEPYLSGVIATNNALAKDASFPADLEEREAHEQDLFGVWPVRCVRKKAEIDIADAKLLKRSKIKVGDNIRFI